MVTYKLNPEDFEEFSKLVDTPLPDISKLEKLAENEMEVGE